MNRVRRVVSRPTRLRFDRPGRHPLRSVADNTARNASASELAFRSGHHRAGDLGPAVLYDKLSTTKRKAVMKALDTRECRIVACVDMLGEGLDLPSLKIAALHDIKKSLSPMIQFIGRFTRSVSASSTIGTAGAFVANDPSTALSPLRALLREDADWNLLLRRWHPRWVPSPTVLPSRPGTPRSRSTTTDPTESSTDASPSARNPHWPGSSSNTASRPRRWNHTGERTQHLPAPEPNVYSPLMTALVV